jgi:predicted phosphodiesterase
VGPGRVEVAATLTGHAATVLELPPLGRISASTHRTPVRLSARVVEVDVDAVQRHVSGPDPVRGLTAEVEGSLPGLLRSLVLRALLTAGLAGAVLAWLAPGRRWWHGLVGGASGPLAVTGLLALTWMPYDLSAFDEPRYEGALERVPGLIVAAERNLEELEEIQGRVEVVSRRLADLYAASSGDLPGGAPDETAILHVSDIHLNPLAMELVARLARDFAVDAVLDTGDITSFGYPLEARFAELVARVPVPYYLVPGNHDSPQNRAELDADPAVIVVDREVVDIGGVRVLGMADPTFTADNAITAVQARDIKQADATRVAAVVRSSRPDVLAVHDPVQASESHGLVPLVVAGHLHRSTTELIDGTLQLTVGTTGATGLGSFTVETDLPYVAQVLRFVDGDLVAIDHITVSGLVGEFTVQRRLPPDGMRVRSASGPQPR